MIYTELVRQAMNLAYEAHKGQVDKAGYPYIFHPYTVANEMQDENTTITALLHDVIEDTQYTIEKISKLGFSSEVITALELLTKNPKEDYMKYIRRLKGNLIAREVKKADLKHNMDLSRLPVITEKDRKRKQQYERALEILNTD